MSGSARPFAIAASFDGGDKDCGNGLLLLIRRHIDPVQNGGLLELFSTESSVAEDLPSWCRLTGNELVLHEQSSGRHRFLIAKGRFQGTAATTRASRAPAPLDVEPVSVVIPKRLPSPSAAAPIPRLAVFGVGSWPRDERVVAALKDRHAERIDDASFGAVADDAVAAVVDAQREAGVDVYTDGEQRRDNYASFVGERLDNCQLVPITDLLPYVDHPEDFERQLRDLDVPAGDVRHPAVFGRLSRSRPLVGHEVTALRRFTGAPVKVALPGPYLLARTMWMECISDRAYESREALAVDIVRVLREELHFLLADGVPLVQFDEPVLTEVVHGRGRGQRVFMCGALGERRPVDEELEFARDLLAQVCHGLPPERLALHICRGNWSPDERVALSGDYGPLLPFLSSAPVGTLLLELCTPRAGEIDLLRALPADKRVGVGVVNPKSPRVEAVDEVLDRIVAAVDRFGADRVLLHPDCGFATFADNPVASSRVAIAKLRAIVDARDRAVRRSVG